MVPHFAKQPILDAFVLAQYCPALRKLSDCQIPIKLTIMNSDSNLLDVTHHVCSLFVQI